MNSSGIKRGLAYSAITALAVTGVPFLATSASANPIDDQVTEVTLLSQYSGATSLKNDGTDSTIRLEAAAPATVTSVTFQYRIADAAPWQTIAAVGRNDDGAFSTEWAAAGVVGGNVDLRVINTAEVANVAPPAASEDQVDNIDISGPGAGVESVNLTADSQLGVFQSPYATGQNVIVTGTTSSIDTADDVTVEVLAGTATGNNALGPVEVAQGATTGTFAAVLDITGYTYGATDQLVVGASLDSDDVESYTLYKQTITTVTAATPDGTTVPIGGTTPVVVTVLDQANAPIAGARVTDGDGNVFYTDENGQVATTQDAGTEFYYADATAANGYNAAAGDKRSNDVTVNEFAPAPTTLVATSDDGLAFDFDENDGDDITVQVKNQNGGNYDVDDAQDLAYYWVITPFDGSPATVREPATGTTPALTDTNGEFVVVFPAGESGTYELFASLTADGLGNNAISSSKVLTVKAGEAGFTFVDGDRVSAPAGSEKVVSGELELEDGTGLAGRLVDLYYTQGSGTDAASDAGFAPVAPAPGSPNDSYRQVTTGANGGLSVTVDDEAETPQGTEVNGYVEAYTTNTPNIGDAGAYNYQYVDFTSSTPPTGTTVVVDENTGTTRPGESTGTWAQVTAPDNTNDTDPVTPGVQGDGDTDRDFVVGQVVTLTVDKGFFTTGDEETPSVVGTDAGNLQNLGATITRVTDSQGWVYFENAIERDAGFDDDGMVKATVTATAGSASDTEDVDFDSSNPINGGTVEIALSPASEQDGATGPASAGNRVFYDVFTTDQFGNLVGDEYVELSYTGDLDSWDYSNSAVYSDFDDNGDFWVTSYETADINIAGEWDTETRKYTNTTGSTTDSTETLTDSVTAEFYEAVVTTTTIESSPEGEVPVGTAVTETVTVLDQEGNPIQGVSVEFIRNGPGAGDGDANVTRTTNAQGKAFYTFIGTEAGVANITATVTSDDGIETLNDSVVFVAEDEGTGGPRAIKAFLSGKDNGPAKDKLTVKAPAMAAGAEVRLFKVIKGKRIQVGNTKGLNAAGDATFIVKDTNGGQITKYVAVVVKTDKTLSDTTNPKRVR